MARPLFTPGKDPVVIVQEAGWAPGPVWTGEGKISPPLPGIRSPDCPKLYKGIAYLYILVFLCNVLMMSHIRGRN